MWAVGEMSGGTGGTGLALLCWSYTQVLPSHSKACALAVKTKLLCPTAYHHHAFQAGHSASPIQAARPID